MTHLDGETNSPSFLKLRSMIAWTTKGDANTAFYHTSIKSRQQQNQINFLLDDDDIVIDSLVDIKEHTVNYFNNLLGDFSISSSAYVSDIERMVPARWFVEPVALLSRNKSPGPYGYHVEFSLLIGKYLVAK